MLPALSTTRHSRRCARCDPEGRLCTRLTLDCAQQLIKKLSATPVIPSQNDAALRAAGPLDPQAALQANKATFFFQLVSAAAPTCPTLEADCGQERELEKVNAFYLQKEAEVRTLPVVHPAQH
ncbi:hypothetical protein BT67DRAFT_445179 [Trichocladium antarcticum]|uniref:Uncharacterized protein n=1 Tax=Trichocladium antarcticum TaxID=1450529 RepID=A0AAN6UDU7_9PEZI|nr:hypothetical protein BT67DRAFT_445179 [Trichocladium antarcticum]